MNAGRYDVAEVNLAGDETARAAAVSLEVHHAAVVVGRCGAEVVGGNHLPYVIAFDFLVGEDRVYAAVGERFAPGCAVRFADRGHCRGYFLGGAAFGDSLHDGLYETLVVEAGEFGKCVVFVSCAFDTFGDSVEVAGEVFVDVVFHIAFTEGVAVGVPGDGRPCGDYVSLCRFGHRDEVYSHGSGETDENFGFGLVPAPSALWQTTL